MIIFKMKLLIFISDINECGGAEHNCSEHAMCINNNGSYTCDCKEGFTGDGFSCDGRQLELWKYSK